MTKTSNVKSNNTVAKKSTKSAPTAIENKLLTVADVAREMNVNPKTARAYLRRKKLKFATNTFTKTSEMYKNVVAALTQRTMPTAS